MGKVKYLHYSMKDQSEWSNEDWEMYFKDERINEESARQKSKTNEVNNG